MRGRSRPKAASEPMNRPVTALVVLAGLEFWFDLTIPRSSVAQSDMAHAYVDTMTSVLPALRNFRNLPNADEVRFLLSVAPLWLVPKIVFWVQWLRSDRMRNLRYFIISPLTRSIPKNTFDFVTDPLRSDSENRAPERLTQFSLGGAVFLSLAILAIALTVGLFWPFVVYGIDVVKHRDADFRELAVASGGWRFWLAWSVYQMNLSAFCLAIGFSIASDYFRWIANALSTRR